MKRALLLVLAVVLTAAAVVERVAAQRIELGARAGITSQDMELKLQDFATDSKLGWHIAAVSRLKLVGGDGSLLGIGLFLQPEIVFSQNNYKIQSTVATLPPTISQGTSKIRMQSVDIPVLLSLKVSIVRIQAGPVFNVMNKFTTLSGGAIELNPIRPTVGYTVGASVDIFGGLVLDGRYHGEFKELKNNIKDQGTSLGDDIRGSLSSWSLGVSWLF